MMEFQQSSIWQKTLARQMEPDCFMDKRDLLRVEFENFREKAKLLAAEIDRVLPEFTVHDISHIDALWETSELVVKDNIELNPAEVFVLGGSFLIHDLGMGLASFPKGVEELKKESIWRDMAASLLKKKLGRPIVENDFTHLDKDIEMDATKYTLRILHAKQAEKLAKISWKDSRGNDIFLIDNVELREAYGSIIGLIAYSHWWKVSELEEKLPETLGALSLFPSNWTIDPIKLACILRVADATQIDDRRSPTFLKAVREIPKESQIYWDFQQKMYQPRLERNRLVYTSKSSFTVNEVNAWWACFDTLKMIDNELKEVDSLLTNTNRDRMGAIGVAAIENPKRLSKLITVDGWQPVDTKIRVNNVAKLVNSIGGKQLYGDNLLVPLRELIQNASDAIRARRIVENESDTYGDITITINKDKNGKYIEVEDNGIGMSESVLTGPFLDFGQSFWGTTMMHEELPGLESKGFCSTGKYGIGFFSVFMLSKKVLVASNRYDKGRNSTVVLEFNDGVYSRPILRKCCNEEVIKNGGTRIRIWLSDVVLNRMLECRNVRNNKISLSECIETLCPSLDCNILVKEKNKLKPVIKANDWITISPLNLMKRIMGKSVFKSLDSDKQKLLSDISKNMTVIMNEEGHAVGRVVLYKRIELRKYMFNAEGIVTVGGFRTTGLTGMLGILLGRSNTAARDIGVPIVSNSKLREWATNQADLLLKINIDEKSQKECAALIWCCGGYTEKLKIASNREGAVSYDEIKQMIKQTKTDYYILIDDVTVYVYEDDNSCKVNLAENVLCVNTGLPGILQTHKPYYSSFWPNKLDGKAILYNSLSWLAIKAISEGWGCTTDELEKAIEFSTDDKSIEAVVGNVDGKSVKLSEVTIVKKPRK